MRKSLIIPLILLILSPTLAYAGVWGTVTGYIKAEALSLVVGGLIGSLGMLGLSYKLWGVAVKELGECIWELYQSTRPTSNGGKEITKTEMERILKEAAEVYPAVQAAIASHKRRAS
jgi:hypothetical protein